MTFKSVYTLVPWPVLMAAVAASFPSLAHAAENDEQSPCFLPAGQSSRVQASPPAMSL